VAAASSLGWKKVSAHLFKAEDQAQGPLLAELAAIHETLRKPLPTSATAQQFAQLKKTFGRLYPEAKHGGARGASRHDGDLKEATKPQRFTQVLSKSAGFSERSAQRLAQIGEKASPLILKALDNGFPMSEATQCLELSKKEQESRIRAWEQQKQEKRPATALLKAMPRLLKMAQSVKSDQVSEEERKLITDLVANLETVLKKIGTQLPV
jgi:hypothetical protein